MFTTFGVGLSLGISLQIHSPAFQQSPASPHFLFSTPSSKCFSVLRTHPDCPLPVSCTAVQVNFLTLQVRGQETGNATARQDFSVGQH